MNTTKEKHKVTCYEVDRLKILKPFSLMNYAQEIANQSASKLGYGYDDLVPKDLAWVLSRVNVEILKAPQWRDNFSIETWHKGQERLFSLRDFLIYDSDEQPVIAITSSWLLINASSRRIQKFEILLKEDAKFEEYGYLKDAIIDRPVAIDSPETVVALDHHRVKCSDIDLNGHVNNAKYIELAMDRLDSSLLESFQLKDFQINFNHESLLDDIISFNMSDEELSNGDRIVYIEGLREEQNIFAIRFRYAKA